MIESEEAETRTSLSKVKSKLIIILSNRFHDKSGFVRKEACMAFQFLLNKNVISGEELTQITELARGRIGDERVTVRKEAIKLIEDIVRIKSLAYDADKGDGFLSHAKLDEVLNHLKDTAKRFTNEITEHAKMRDQIEQHIRNENSDLSELKLNQLFANNEEISELKSKIDQ